MIKKDRRSAHEKKVRTFCQVLKKTDAVPVRQSFLCVTLHKGCN